MRDIVFSAIVVALLAAVLRQPVVGAYLWAWLGLMNPHKLTWGFAFNLPWAQVAAAVTLLAWLFTRQKKPVPLNAIVVVQVSFLVWMSISSLTAYASAEVVWERWVFVMKIQLMLLVTWMLVITPQQLRVLIWVVTLSVAFFGIKGGIWTVLTGGGGRVWGPPGGMLSGNNELAVGLVILMPMLYYLRHTEPRRWLRWVLLGAMVSCSFAILGSQSRGALVALLAMAFFLGMKGKYPVRTSLALALLVALAIAFMPDSWTQRMETIGSYQEDTSAMSRLWTWQTLWNAAVAHPVTGVGFRADNQAVFSAYAPTDGIWAVFAGRVYVAHSIYFQVLGEHGFVGLGLFLGLGVATWLTARSVARRATAFDDFASWMPLLMRMVQVSLVGYAAGGAFLSLAYLDLPYYIMGFVVICDALLRRRVAEMPTAAPNDNRHESGASGPARRPPTSAPAASTTRGMVARQP